MNRGIPRVKPFLPEYRGLFLSEFIIAVEHDLKTLSDDKDNYFAQDRYNDINDNMNNHSQIKRIIEEKNVIQLNESLEKASARAVIPEGYDKTSLN
ncbi:MAG: hypothetical protein K2Q15_11995, partial [Burkholderiales bacterium]|nr:hypothetical protein [Burkholderiales bacterium]